MSDLLSGLSQSISGMQAQARRLRHATENAANADTPGYRRKVIDFQQDRDGFVRPSPARLGSEQLKRIYQPNHPLADASGYYNGSNVELLVEMTDAKEAQRSYEANLRMFDQSRQMMQGLIELIRR